jgi:hypothetical protein
MRASLAALPFVLCSGCASLAPSDSPRAVERGPVAVKTNGPISGTFLQFRPRSMPTTPVTQVAVAYTSSYSNVYENGAGDGATVVLDGEIWRPAFIARTGVTDTADIEFELPFVYGSSGFLDGVIESWHSFFGQPNGGREARDKNDYDMVVTKDGQEIFHLEGNDLALGDIPITFTQRIGTTFALRAGLELPTGDEGEGFGNGGWDWGGGACYADSFGRVSLSAGAYYVIPATPSAFERADVDVEDQIYAHGGFEMRWNDASSLLLGMRWSTPVTSDIGIMEINGDVLDLDVGLAIDTGARTRLVLGFTEDLIAESGPDFTLFAAYTVGY